MPTQRRWRELSRSQQTTIAILGAVEVVLTAAALADLAGRPAEQVRGPKALWALCVFMQPVGPIAYLAIGRRHTN